MLKRYKPTSQGQRTRKTLVREVSKARPVKALTSTLKGPAGRNRGRIATRYRERGTKKRYRIIDFKRNKLLIPAKVASIEYDGNALPLENIPLGTSVHNIELNIGGGGVLARGAGNSAQVLAKEGAYVNLRLPSGEVKKILGKCYASVGTLSNPDTRNVRLGKAGKRRYLGFRPHVRGVAMANPKKDHPHAGKYGTTGIGRPAPLSPWGWKTRGVKSRKRVHTDYTIVKKREKKK
ncbi:MAG: 50S ribosomal protein L2 [candidate division WWE3 bacterium GW2011_GWA2_42_9]|nr:MAG: 50S ribosomal protein L2 [candidate division WWE3 bacterium GW2011_GWA2_42_9]